MSLRFLNPAADYENHYNYWLSCNTIITERDYENHIISNGLLVIFISFLVIFVEFVFVIFVTIFVIFACDESSDLEKP